MEIRTYGTCCSIRIPLFTMTFVKIKMKVNKLLITLYALMVLGLLGSLGLAVHQNWLLKIQSTRIELARQAGIGNFIVENTIVNTTKSLGAAQKAIQKTLDVGPISASQARDSLLNTLNEFNAHHNAPYSGLILYLDREGMLLTRTDELNAKRVDFSSQVYFQRLRQKPDTAYTISPLYPTQKTGEWFFHVAMPLKDRKGKFQGVLAQRIQTTAIAKELNKYMDSSKSVQMVTQSPETGLSFAYPLNLLTHAGPEAIDTPYADFARRSTSPQDTFTWPTSADSKEPRALVGYAHAEQSKLLTTVHQPLSDVWFNFFLENLPLLSIAGLALVLITGISLHLYRISKRLSEAVHDAFFDALTKIPNRRAFDDMYPRLLRDAARSQQPLSVLFIDIDHFKRFNDDYGHDCGDMALKAVAQSLRHCATRPLDFVCRWGGEEFIVLLPHTSQEAAELMAQKILLAVREIQLQNEQGTPMRRVSVSIGVASKLIHSQTQGSGLLTQADEAMKQAKFAGRDRHLAAHP